MRKRKPESTAAVAARVARFDERLQSAGGLLIRCTLRLREDELVAHYRALLAAGIGPDHIPDELAEQQPDGSLMIYVEVAGRRLGMGVPRGHWRWMRRE